MGKRTSAKRGMDIRFEVDIGNENGERHVRHIRRAQTAPTAEQHGDHQDRKADFQRLIGNDERSARVDDLFHRITRLTHGGAKWRFQWICTCEK